MHVIRETIPADGPHLAALVRSTLHECLEEYVLQSELQACVDARLGIASEGMNPSQPDMRCYVAEADGQLVGYGLVQISATTRGDSAFSSVSNDRLYIRRSWQGKGLAKGLAETMKPRTALAAQTTIEAWHTTMRALYTRWGFVDVGALSVCMSGPSHMMHAVMEVTARA